MSALKPKATTKSGRTAGRRDTLTIRSSRQASGKSTTVKTIRKSAKGGEKSGISKLMGAPTAGRGATLLYRGDRATHVLLPIVEYERLLAAQESRQLVAALEDPAAKWVKAEDAALEIAGTWLARARKRSGLTQKELAERLGLPQSQISRIEKRPERSTIRTMERIAGALGVDIATLVGFAKRG